MNNIMTVVVEFLITMLHNPLIKLVVIFIILDTIFGLARAIKEREFNSCFGIDGAIRKFLMIISVTVLAIVDGLIGFNMLPFVPEDMLNYIGLTKLGICEFFCLLYVMYEAVSILKNMCLCGLPMPKWARERLQNWLDKMTGELRNENTKELSDGSND